MKEEKQNGLSHSTASIFSVLFNLDTQSAITAALFVSLLTVASSFFVNLCNYVYWYAYFTRFQIPMAYFEEAIIPERGFLYAVAMCVPVALLWWWGMHKIAALFNRWFPEKPMDAKKQRCRKFVLISFYVVILLALLGGGIFIPEILPEGVLYFLWTVLHIEIGLFVFQKIFRFILGYNYAVSEKTYLIIRVLAVLFLIYAILGGVFFAGQQENYSGNAGQSLKIVNDPQINVFEMENGEEMTIDLVLLETSDYYYVTQSTLRKTDNALYMQVWDDDTYRFVNKIDHPVKSIYAQLWYNNSGNQATMDTLHVLYIFAVAVGSIVFMGLFSLPKKERVRETPPRDEQQTIAPQ